MLDGSIAEVIGEPLQNDAPSRAAPNGLKREHQTRVTLARGIQNLRRRVECESEKRIRTARPRSTGLDVGLRGGGPALDLQL